MLEESSSEHTLIFIIIFHKKLLEKVRKLQKRQSIHQIYARGWHSTTHTLVYLYLTKQLPPISTDSIGTGVELMMEKAVRWFPFKCNVFNAGSCSQYPKKLILVVRSHQ